MRSFPCTLVTPSGVIHDGPAVSVVAPGFQGSFGVLAGHAQVVTILKRGVLSIKTESGDQFYAMDSGVLEVNSQHEVSILADRVIKADNNEDAKLKLGDLEKTSS